MNGIARVSRLRWIEFLLLGAIAGLFYGAIGFAREWTGGLRPTVEINLSPWALPGYTFFSLSRGLIAYVFSLCFTLVYGYWAAHDPLAERALVPLLDILQSIPVLGFMPGLILTLVALFPKSNFGLELAAVIMIFTGQAWNMTFSFFHSLRSIPKDQLEAARLYRFNWWRSFVSVELPFSTMGLVWNSMMSMAGGWFFLMISEAFALGGHDFRLPGIGSYMSVAAAKGDGAAMAWAVLAMALMIVALDQFLWRPVVVWAQKFRVEEGGAEVIATSWFLDWLRKSRIVGVLRGMIGQGPTFIGRMLDAPAPLAGPVAPKRGKIVSYVALAFFGALALAGAVKLVELVRHVAPGEWASIVGAAFVTLSRVLVSTALGTLWALPAGLAIGLSPRLSALSQPVVQVLASFPAPMLFPALIALMRWAGVPLGWGSIVLMLMGTQWYILFNVLAGAQAIPADLREAARSYRLGRIARFRTLYFPAVFPYLITGWVTAAGGAWNASIVAEYVSFKGEVLKTWGLGAKISEAAEKADFASLAAGVLVMSALVVLFNRSVWERFYRLARERFSLSK